MTVTDQPIAYQPIASFDAIKRAWADTRCHPIWFAGSFILVTISICSSFLSRPIVPAIDPTKELFREIAVAIVAVMVGATFQATYQREHLRFQRGEKPKLRGMFNTMQTEWSLSAMGIICYIPHLAAWLTFKNLFPETTGWESWWMSLVQMLISYLLLPFSFAGLFIVDQGCGPFEALHKSWQFTLVAPRAILWTLFLSTFLGSLGALACGFGYIFTAPIIYLKPSILYEDNRKAGFFV